MSRLIVASTLVLCMSCSAAPAQPPATETEVQVSTKVAVEQTAARDVRRVVRPSLLSRDGPAAGAPVPQGRYGACAAADAAATYPGAHWETDSRGWDEPALEQAWEAARRAHWVSGMLVHRGRVVSHFGPVDRPYETRSIRKSLLGAVAGQLVADGKLRLDATLAELGVDEDRPLSTTEKTATVHDLLTSRSGVYRPAAYTTRGDREDMPAPGSHAPGTHYWYNNWDFNALGTIVRRAGGADIGRLFEAGVARPIGMEDFTAADVRDRHDDVSRHPAYLIDMSTRDRARFGLLYLRNGCWNGRQVVPADWVAASFKPWTDRDGADDYGYLWRSQEGVTGLGLNARFYSARGNHLQYVMVIPEHDLVLVLTTDMGFPGPVNMARDRLGLMPEIGDVADVLRTVIAARPR